MRFHVFSAVCSVAILVCGTAQAAWVDEEFNASLGSQWTAFYDTTTSVTPPGTVSGGQFHITAVNGTDHFRYVDNYAYIQCDAPTGTNWEVKTLLLNFNPTESGKHSVWNRAGLMLHSDNNHWMWVGVNSDGNDRRLSAYFQYDPIPLPATESGNWDDYFDAVDLGGVTTDPIHLKIAKTPEGYCAYASGDGSYWQQIGPVIKNPDAADGYFPNERIQLMTCAVGPGVPDQADFEYVRKTDLVSATRPFASDEFSAPLDADLWTTSAGAVLPGGINVSGGKLNMSMNVWSDEWTFHHESMFAAQDAPTSRSYRVCIKGGPTDLTPMPNIWSAWGMELWQHQNEKIMILCSRGDNATSQGVQVLYWRGNPVTYDAYWIDCTTTDSVPEYLGIEKIGNTIAAAYSYDDVNWVRIPDAGKDYTGRMPNPQVRLMGRRFQWPAGDQNVYFDWVRGEALATPTAAKDWQLFN